VLQTRWLNGKALPLRNVLCEANSYGFSNLIQFISCAVLLRTHQYTVLQSSVTGSILANILFLLGVSIVASCWNGQGKYLDYTKARMASNLLSLASSSLLIPTASKLLNQSKGRDLLRQSRGVAIVLVVVYWSFVLWEISYKHHWKFTKSCRSASSGLSQDAGSAGESDQQAAKPTDKPGSVAKQVDAKPRLHMMTAIFLLAGSTTLLYFHIDYAANGIESLSSVGPLSKTFVGLVLFPLANCDYVPIMLAWNGKLHDTVTQTVGKSIQTAFLVLPCVVLLAWIWQLDEVTFVLDGFEVVSLLMSILLLNFLLVDTKVQWQV
jgi:Ca2+:H+ antiporter